MITYDQYREKCRQIVRDRFAPASDDMLEAMFEAADVIADATWPAIEATTDIAFSRPLVSPIPRGCTTIVSGDLFNGLRAALSALEAK